MLNLVLRDGDTPVVAMRPGRTPLDVTQEPLKVQLETFLRWVYLHTLREFAQHCGHADILREQILSAG